MDDRGKHSTPWGDEKTEANNASPVFSVREALYYLGDGAGVRVSPAPTLPQLLLLAMIVLWRVAILLRRSQPE